MAKVKQKGVLEVAVYKDFPPYSYVEKGVQKGIDVEIAKELAKRLSVSASLRMVGADENVEDDLRNNVWKGHYLGGGVADVMLHMPVDREFAEENDMVSFISPYQMEALAFAVDTEKLGQDPTVAAFAENSIGVELDTLSDFYLLRAANGAIANSIKHYPNVAEAISGLRKGEVTAVMGPRGELEGQLADKPANIAVKTLMTPGLQRSKWVMGVAVKARNKQLTQAVNDAMAAMVIEGVVAKIFADHGVTYQAPAEAPAAN